MSTATLPVTTAAAFAPDAAPFGITGEMFSPMNDAGVFLPERGVFL